MINTDNVVYLAGAITGKSYSGCTSWRNFCIEEFKKVGIKAISPLRGKEYLSTLDNISGHGREYASKGPLSLPKAVLTRDHWDVIRCKVLFVNLLESTERSVGTIAEIAWKWHTHGPIVLIMEKTPNIPHDHMFVTGMATVHVETIEEGIHITTAMMKDAT